MQIQLKECSGEQKIVIKAGVPLEQAYAGKTMSLEELIVEGNNTVATMIDSSKKQTRLLSPFTQDMIRVKNIICSYLLLKIRMDMVII